jgi:hypothetical protein
MRPLLGGDFLLKNNGIRAFKINAALVKTVEIILLEL